MKLIQLIKAVPKNTSLRLTLDQDGKRTTLFKGKARDVDPLIVTEYSHHGWKVTISAEVENEKPYIHATLSGGIDELL